MTILRILLIVLIPAVQTVLLLLSQQFERFYYSGAAVAFLLTDVLLVPYFSGMEKRSRLYALSLPPLGLVLTTFGVLFFIEEQWLKNAIVAASGLAQLLYVLNLYYCMFKTDRYQERSFSHANALMQTLIVFYAAGVSYGLTAYLDIQIWYWIVPFIVLIGALTAQLFWFHGKSLGQNAYHAWALVLLSAESAITIQLLPSLYLAQAALLATAIITVSNLILSDVRKELTKFEAISTVATALIVVLFITGTAPWR